MCWQDIPSARPLACQCNQLAAQLKAIYIYLSYCECAANQKYVYHAVHMIFKGQFEDWEPGETRGSKLVFIGKNVSEPVLVSQYSSL